MKVEKKILPKSIVELKIEQSKEAVAKFRSVVLNDLRKNADIKGFRKWAKIPDDVIMREFWEERVLQMTIEKAIDALYRETLKKEKLMPVSQAEIVEVSSEDPLIVRIHVEVFPTIDIKAEYKKVKLKKEKVTVAESEVQAALDDIQTRFTHFHESSDTNNAAKMGDKVTIDTDGYDSKGNIMEATSMRDYPLALGSNMLVPWFEEDMVGMKVGEERELDVNFPKDYHNAEFAGKKTKFKVTAKKIELAHKPEFTPEFIEQLRGKKLSLPEFKDLIKKELLDTKESNNQMQRELSLIDELLKHTTLDIGDSMLAGQIEQVYKEIGENVSKDGVKMADYLASLGLSEEEYKKQHVAATALKRLQGELILNTLFDKEKIEVSESEMNSEIEKVMERFDSEDVLSKLKDLYVPGSKYYEELKRRLGLRKLIDSFFE